MLNVAKFRIKIQPVPVEQFLKLTDARCHAVGLGLVTNQSRLLFNQLLVDQFNED